MRILVIEDDDVLADGIRSGLGLGGLTVDRVETIADGREALATSPFDAVILDLMLPDGSGLDLLREVREAGDRTPVLLLTALDAAADKVAGLDVGADDYLGKPFDLDELAARVRAIARRGGGRAAAVLVWRNIALDPGRLTASLNGRPIALSRREFAVLAALMERPGMVFSKTALETKLYGWQEGVESNAIEVYVHNLRAKFGRDTIETVRGIGYRLTSAP